MQALILPTTLFMLGYDTWASITSLVMFWLATTSQFPKRFIWRSAAAHPNALPLLPLLFPLPIEMPDQSSWGQLRAGVSTCPQRHWE